MKILVINAGSSSLKYQLIDMSGENVMCKGLCERIGIEGGRVNHEINGQKQVVEVAMQTHGDAFAQMLRLICEGENAALSSPAEIDAVGHRVTHGGEMFTESAVITQPLVQAMQQVSSLAPLHNPPQLQAIGSARDVLGEDVPMVAVFDTSFHQSMPPKAYLYGVRYEYYEQHALRRYGFHGTSHRFVTASAAEFLQKPAEQLKIITCHLGNGSSIAAVQCGESVDTTMGLTPLSGIPMGTRPGDLDPGVVIFLQQKLNMSAAEVDKELNKNSGLFGLTGGLSDNRDICEAMAKGDARAKISHDVLCYQIKKYIGAYMAAMNGADAIVFTGGIGENSAEVRRDVCAEMDALGIELNLEKNQIRSGEVRDISADGAKVRCLVVPTNEELLIARDTLLLVGKRSLK